MKKKKNYSRGGVLPQEVAGALPLLDMAVPGLGTGLSLLNSFIPTPSGYQPVRSNDNPYGLSRGGVIPTGNDQVLGANAFKVNYPGNATDAKNYGQVNLDKNEIVSQGRVFSDDLKFSKGKSFAKKAEELEKMRSKTKNSEPLVRKGVDMMVESELTKLFTLQEARKPFEGKKVNMSKGGYVGGPDEPLTKEQQALYNEYLKYNQQFNKHLSKADTARILGQIKFLRPASNNTPSRKASTQDLKELNSYLGSTVTPHEWRIMKIYAKVQGLPVDKVKDIPEVVSFVKDLTQGMEDKELTGKDVYDTMVSLDTQAVKEKLADFDLKIPPSSYKKEQQQEGDIKPRMGNYPRISDYSWYYPIRASSKDVKSLQRIISSPTSTGVGQGSQEYADALAKQKQVQRNKQAFHGEYAKSSGMPSLSGIPQDNPHLTSTEDVNSLQQPLINPVEPYKHSNALATPELIQQLQDYIDSPTKYGQVQKNLASPGYVAELQSYIDSATKQKNLASSGDVAELQNYLNNPNPYKSNSAVIPPVGINANNITADLAQQYADLNGVSLEDVQSDPQLVDFISKVADAKVSGQIDDSGAQKVMASVGSKHKATPSAASAPRTSGTQSRRASKRSSSSTKYNTPEFLQGATKKETRDNIKRYQARANAYYGNNLAVDGIYGKNTNASYLKNGRAYETLSTNPQDAPMNGHPSVIGKNNLPAADRLGEQKVGNTLGKIVKFAKDNAPGILQGVEIGSKLVDAFRPTEVEPQRHAELQQIDTNPFYQRSSEMLNATAERANNFRPSTRNALLSNLYGAKLRSDAQTAATIANQNKQLFSSNQSFNINQDKYTALANSQNKAAQQQARNAAFTTIGNTGRAINSQRANKEGVAMLREAYSDVSNYFFDAINKMMNKDANK